MTNECQQFHDDDHLFDDEQAALIIGTTPATLRKSRVTGLLWGFPAPEYLKFSRVVRYKGGTLKRWKHEHGKACSCTADSRPFGGASA